MSINRFYQILLVVVFSMFFISPQNSYAAICDSFPFTDAEQDTCRDACIAQGCDSGQCSDIEEICTCNPLGCEFIDDDFDEVDGTCGGDIFGTCPIGFTCTNSTSGFSCLADGRFDDDGGPVIGDPDDLSKIINLFFDILMPAAVILGLLLIGKSGFALSTSQGDPRKTQEAKEDLTAAVFGLIFVLLSVAILQAIINTLIVS